MTVIPALVATREPHVDYPPRWVYQRISPRVIDEGDAVTFTLKCINPDPGAKIVLWMTGASNLASTANWLESWSAVVKRTVEAAGCEYLLLTGSTTPPKIGTVSWLITIGAGYSHGREMVFANTVRRNRKDNAAAYGDIRGGAGAFQILLQTQAPITTFGSLAPLIPSGGNFVDVRDTSRRPTETPTIRARTYVPGTTTASPSSLLEGDSFELVIETANLIPGTQIRLYAANEGQYEITPNFRTALAAGAKAVPGISCTIPRWTPETASQWFNGGTLTFTDAYDDAQPLRFVMTCKASQEDQPARTLDIIGLIEIDGDLAEFGGGTSRGDWSSTTHYGEGDWVTYVPDGGTYVYIAGSGSAGHLPTETAYWRPYNRLQSLGLGASKTIKEVPPRFWELRATSDGSTITYRIQGPTGHVGDKVTLTSTNAPPGFAAALAAAAHSGAPIRYSGGVLTAQATERDDSSVSFTVPHAGSGKHVLRLSDPVGTSPIVIADACVYLTPPTLPAQPAFVVGTNLAGGDFGKVYTEGTTFGGYGNQYVYPSEPESGQHREMDYHWSKGVRIIRVPFKWERVQPELFGPLYGDSSGAWTGRQDMRRIDELVDYWTNTLGGIVLLDCHNYMSYRFSADSSGKVRYEIGTAVPIAALSDLWERLANRYATNGKVWLDLMNEPSGDGATTIRTRDNMHAVVNAIRARTPALNMILVEGASFSSAAKWVSGGQATAFDDFYDPADNFAFSPHCYLDADASGTKGSCIAGAQSRLGDVTAWARGKGFKLFLGEIAGGSPSVIGQEACGTVVPAAYSYMVANDDVWIGWTTWGGGRFWNTSYAFRLDPRDYAAPVDSGAMDMLEPFLTP